MRTNSLQPAYLLLAALSLLVFVTSCQIAGLLGESESDASISDQNGDPAAVVPFTNVANTALEDGFGVWNDRPGVVIFDYDRDGDMDFYVTQMAGHANWLYRNNGDETFSDVGSAAGVALENTHSTGAVACDINNDGFQDLYVGAWGNPADDLGFRSPQQGNLDALLLNMKDGTFVDITKAAFGDNVNARSATSIGCADVNLDGWLDLFVGNLMDQDFRHFEDLNHPGHYNKLYMNNGDLTFEDVTESAGVQGPQILMRYPDNTPVSYMNPETGEAYEGYNPLTLDAQGNRAGEPTGQTHAVLFFDYDDDLDPDLWIANDADRLHLYRNDSDAAGVRFTPMARTLGIDKVGAWMGFAVGDFDGDVDLDVFVPNVGFHTLIQPPRQVPRGTCEYFGRFATGTCTHFLLSNGGGGRFVDVAGSTTVKPSPWFPPISLDPSTIDPGHQIPTGIAAYDFGFGATFFDYENDGDQDLYWFGSTMGRGGGPDGHIFPAAGRMMRGDNTGAFEDITVRARLLDITHVSYDGLDEDQLARRNPAALQARRIDRQNHENGKGLAHGDLNGDGFVDLIATNSSGDIFIASLPGAPPTTAPRTGPLFVWLNGNDDNHWLSLRLKGRMAVDGTGSNADGIGARVYVTTLPSPHENPRVQVQEVRAGSSYLSMDSIDLEFGLGKADKAEKIEIIWPSGRTQVVEDVDADQIMTITEPSQ